MTFSVSLKTFESHRLYLFSLIFKKVIPSQEKTLENLYPQIIARINNGDQVVFASLTIDRNGISGIPWTELSAVKLKEDIIEVKDGTGQALISSSYSATPNAHILMVLLREKLPFEV